MRKIFLILSTTLFCLTSFKTEEVDIYSVIRVMGSISHIESGKALFTGDKVRSNEKLDFKTTDAKAAVISSKNGRFILASTTNNQMGLMPAMNNISSRAGAIINSIDLQNHFTGNYLILPNYEIEINESSFPMNDKNFFFLRYTYKNEIISKKLSFENNKLHLYADDILKIDGKSIELPENTTMTLFYRNAEDNTSTKMTEFSPIFPNEEQLKTEIKIILSEYSDKNTEQKINEITAYLNENYGKPYKGNLMLWFNSFNFN